MNNGGIYFTCLNRMMRRKPALPVLKGCVYPDAL